MVSDDPDATTMQIEVIQCVAIEAFWARMGGASERPLAL